MISELTNLLLMRGMIGKPGAGVCPVRGHSNVQGDRTMGIWEKMPEEFLAALDAEFGIVSPRKHGIDTVDAIRAMRDGQRQGVHRRWAATSRRPPRTPRSPRPRCAAAR